MARRKPAKRKKKTDATWLRQQLAEGRAAPVYLLHGPDDYEREELVDKITSSVLDESTRTFNYDLLIGADLDVGDAVNRITAFPMMAERRVVIIRRIEEVAEAAARGFLPVVSSPVESTVLVFTADKIDGRRKFFQELKKSAIEVEFRLPYENELPRWITDRAGKIGKQIEPEAVHLLALSLGPRPRELANELEKLDIHTGDQETIKAEDVAWIVGASRDASVFDFVDAVGRAEGARALGILQRLVEQGDHPVWALAMLVRHFGHLRKTRWLLDSNLPRKDYASKLKVSPFTVEKYVEQAEHLSESFLWRAYDSLLQTDDRLKSRSRTPYVTLSRTVVELCKR
ncbi:MAG: DNA polymerase III subunit delta [Gemmatimonadetes bacterium]|nr:DNA polymerase III subunit delta [Gemmatimonadota bacterium]|tara:strand:- start:8967 stop:9995 length:1029 start_codon:yes stop_codon:yes gene_type:complete